MSGSDYAALYAAVQARLDNGHAYGRQGKHSMGACQSCHITVCLTHHHCPKAA